MYTNPDFAGRMKVIYHKNFGCVNIPQNVAENVSSMKMYGYCLSTYEQKDCRNPLKTYKEMEIMSLGKYRNRIRSIFTFDCKDLETHIEQWWKSVVRKRQKMNRKLNEQNVKKNQLIQRFRKLQRGSSAYDFLETSLDTKPIRITNKNFKNSIDIMREKWKLRMYKKYLLKQKLWKQTAKTTKAPSSF